MSGRAMSAPIPTVPADATPAGSAVSALPSFTMTDGFVGRLDSEALVWHINVVCLGLLAFLVVLRLPQFIAMVSQREWLESHFLRHVARRPLFRRSISSAIYSAYNYKGDYKDDASSIDGDSVYMHSVDSLPSEKAGSSTSTLVAAPPTHMPATYFVKLRPLLHPLRRRVIPGFTISQTILVLLYTVAMLYGTFYKSNIFTDTRRTGWIATAQLPIVFAMAQKNSVIGSLLGYGYEKLNYLHRYAGAVVVIATNIHTFHFVYRWVFDGTFTTFIKNPHATWGTIATCCINMIYFFSTAYWRQKAYNVFLATHVVGFSLLLPALYLHKPTTLPYIIASVAFFGLDHAMRLLKTRYATAVLRPIPELDLTRVEIRELNAGWRAGQHVRLRVLSAGMGPVGWAEMHPFTIASVARSEEGLVLICKKAGGWTRRMYDLAKAGGGPADQGAVDVGGGRQVKVMVEGPYGGPQRTVLESFSSAVFVAAGSGITFALAAIEDLIQKDLAGESRIKVIELLWVIRDPSHLTPMLAKFTDLIQSSSYTAVRISVFYTRAPTGQQPPFYHAITDAPYVAVPAPAHQQYFPPGLTLSPGRPRIAVFIELAIQRAVARHGALAPQGKGEALTGLVLGVCGPMSLADDVARAVAAVDPVLRDQVGGIEICEEVFGW